MNKASAHLSKIRSESVTANGWFKCSDLSALLRDKPVAPMGKVYAYWRRESYIEAHFQGIVLIQKQRVKSELMDPSFSFVPHLYRRRIVKHCKVTFLAGPLCKFGKLTCWGDRYADCANVTKAERLKNDDGWQREQYITVDSLLLSSYCLHYGLVPLLVVDSYRFTERLINEMGVSDGWEEFCGESYHYSVYTGTKKHPANRPMMSSCSIICGKRLLFAKMN